MSGECDRARQWASTEVDGELSSFECVLLHAHLDACPSCREFSETITGLTTSLRQARLEQLERPIAVGRPRRRARLRLAPAAAAMAVAAVGLGSFLATSMRSGSVAPLHTPAQAVVGPFATLDTMDLRTSEALKRLNEFQQASAASAARSLRGGPVLKR